MEENQTPEAAQVPKTEIPTGVKVVSVLYYIGAVFGVLIGLLFLIGAGMMGSVAGVPFLAFLGSGLFFLGGIILIALGVLSFFIGRGLWRARPWARTLAIIFAAIGFLMALMGIFQGEFSNFVSLIINAAIGGYLWFNAAVKQVFT